MTKSELVRELKKIGIKEGMELEVHSSLSSFGYVEGGGQLCQNCYQALYRKGRGCHG